MLCLARHTAHVTKKMKGQEFDLLQIIKKVLCACLPRWALIELRGFKMRIFNEPRSKQFVALERHRIELRKVHEPFITLNEVLLLPASEAANALTLSVMYINTADVKGDIAEFGTMSGLTARTIATAMVFDPQRQPSYPFRQLQLFDSFEGLPEITSDVDISSPHVRSGDWSKGGCLVLAESELLKLITGILPPERVAIHKGWFSDTLKALPNHTRFAMIHFDGDLYQSTIDALTPCFERGFVSKGAVICFDDWNCNQADPSFGERKAWAELVEKFEISASHCGDYGSMGTKFIVHSYRGLI